MKSAITGILLAAGQGRRFGGDKLSIRLDGNVCVAVMALRTLRQGVDRALVVVSSDQDALAGILRAEGADIVVCRQAALGMGHSLACGVQASRDAEGWLIALADMPWIQPATIMQLTQRLRQGAELVAPLCGGHQGHPVGFSRRFGDDLEGLTGDQGAKALLRRYADCLEWWVTDDVAVLQDIDHPADIMRLNDRI